MRSVRREGLFSVLQLSAALSVNDRTRAILDGTVAPQGIGLLASAMIRGRNAAKMPALAVCC